MRHAQPRVEFVGTSFKPVNFYSCSCPCLCLCPSSNEKYRGSLGPVPRGNGSARRFRVSRPTSLDSLRAQIDHLDEQLVRLLNRRAELCVRVGHAKTSRAKYAPEREKRIFQRIARLNGGPLRAQHVRTLFPEGISSCLALEPPVRIAYLGPAGTYSQQAAAEQFGSGAALLPFASVDAVFDEAERGRAEYGVVPVENSTEGVVAQTLDRFISSPLSIKAEVLLRIDHCLLARAADV